MKIKKPDERMRLCPKVIEASRSCREDYVKEVNQGEMVGWAVRGLYRRVEEKRVPTTSSGSLARSRT